MVEYFTSIAYLGGRRTANFIRGPKNIGDGPSSGVIPRINLGGPSQTTCDKYQAGYTNNPGVIKPLLVAIHKFIQQSKTTKNIEYPCSVANDGNSLKHSIEFDERLKENVGLLFNIDLTYVNENKRPSREMLEEQIVTVALVTSSTTLDNKVSLHCAVEYLAKKGKRNV